uniref:Nuclease associated modular domain-containing protein n=1 Tax=viral metagenome TaxID=1070528 RepID=A0A6M3M4E2_9ZZZZ
MQIKKTVRMIEIENTFQEDIEALITGFRKENKYFKDIGMLFGVHGDTVRKWAIRFDIDIKVKKPAYNKGKKLSKETCLKMSLSRTGKKHPFYGKHHTEETKKKISEHNAHFWKGKHLSAEARKKLSIAHTGKIVSEESKQKNREKHLGKNSVLFGKHLSAETRKKISIAKKGKPLSETHKQSLRKPKREGTGEIRRRIALARPDEITRKCLIRRVPSSLEKRFLDIVDKLHLPYRFIGNGDFIIERKNPDFINMNGEKILVEVYCTKHKERFRDSGVEGWKQERLNVFGKYGWKVEFFNELQINEKEIKTRLG